MPSTWPFCPVTPIHRPSELAESTGRGPRGQEHRIRMQTLGPRAPGPGSQAQGQRLQQRPQGRHVGWGPRPRLSVSGLGWHQARSSDSQVAMADTLFSEMGLGPATKGATRPAGEGGLAGGGHLQSTAGIILLWGPPGPHEACLLPQSGDPPAKPHLGGAEQSAGLERRPRGCWAPPLIRSSAAYRPHPGQAWLQEPPLPHTPAVPLDRHGRHNNVHKLISLSNGLQPGRRPQGTCLSHRLQPVPVPRMGIPPRLRAGRQPGGSGHAPHARGHPTHQGVFSA